MQYTRNMVTGASTADAVVLLVDARKGVLEQTRRHLAVVALLRVPHVIVAVNKIDLLGYSEERFTAVADAVRAVAAELGIASRAQHPGVGAGGRQHRRPLGRARPGTTGPTLVQILETLPGLDAAEAAEHATEAVPRCASRCST